MIDNIADIEKNMKNDKTVQEVDILDRYPNGWPKIIYFKIRLTGMSSRDSV